ncbi:hypothetical protein [Yinghuangia sp. YIM S10712]|uniref:hypothetical protein n=1 Tax=Yinghuangia sp. YIM S10712 TaxID=3436930 RepID=UPI003F535B29
MKKTTPDHMYAVMGPDAATLDAMSRREFMTLLEDAQTFRDSWDCTLRALLAYAREFRDQPYKLEELASAAGMSVSGVRTAYGPAEIWSVAMWMERLPENPAVMPPEYDG